MVLVHFVNRSQSDFHHAILQSLEDKGPCPTTVLAYRSEMNDKQIQAILDYLEERKIVKRSPVTLRLRNKQPIPYSLSARFLVEITDKGRRYLTLLEKMNKQLNLNLNTQVRVSAHKNKQTT